ncbi:hypothetical protein EWM64_g5880 [Hericium alpestre]|uniref:Uncharacterized protein n=1 Tax=Hericium alpestre TaxID=135208 RepID=A0A4Y9ZVQ4_9AGAM|nr:hypothetical protein EWM64_g5880 [Hericium alpestre]
MDVDEVRRGNMSSQDLDLDPRYAMRAEDERDDLAAFRSALAPPRHVRRWSEDKINGVF